MFPVKLETSKAASSSSFPGKAATTILSTTGAIRQALAADAESFSLEKATRPGWLAIIDHSVPVNGTHAWALWNCLSPRLPPHPPNRAVRKIAAGAVKDPGTNTWPTRLAAAARLQRQRTRRLRPPPFFDVALAQYCGGKPDLAALSGFLPLCVSSIRTWESVFNAPSESLHAKKPPDRLVLLDSFTHEVLRTRGDPLACVRQTTRPSKSGRTSYQ
ncbi:hypothetical protein PG994_004457 [Apiospora phragmitis]|uniref:Uncharacterized protein n=1 Tax=Apiospora phragmitis TaxID=2905665 RepID=A0ABR1VQM6_9PEZI